MNQRLRWSLILTPALSLGFLGWMPFLYLALRGKGLARDRTAPLFWGFMLCYLLVLTVLVLAEPGTPVSKFAGATWIFITAIACVVAAFATSLPPDKAASPQR